MKYVLTFLTCTLAATAHLYAATFILDSQDSASSNGKPLTVQILVDPEGTPLSSLAGTFSFPSNLFDVGSITTQSSAVSVWVTRPQVSSTRYFDSRTRISFEGIMPGGFVGVRSPYYTGVKPGVVFTVTLLPKAKGTGTLLIDDTELHAYDIQGTFLVADSVSKTISVPELTSYTEKNVTPPTKVTSDTLTTSIARDPFISGNDWYLLVNEDESVRPIDHIEVAESSEYSPDRVASYEWKPFTNPYVLLYQSRIKYIHVKVSYTNNTYAFATIAPVENSTSPRHLSLILFIVVILLVALYRNANTITRLFRR